MPAAPPPRCRAARPSASSSRPSCSGRRPGATLYVLDEPTTGPALRGHPQAARVHAAAGRRRQHDDRDRAQPRRREVRRLDRRPRTRGWSRRRHGRRAPARRRRSRSAAASHTGRALRRWLAPRRRRSAAPPARRERRAGRGADAHRGARRAAEQPPAAIDVSIPLDRFTVVTGPSGSGKTSPGVRHAVQRGPAPLRREPVDLRAALPRPPRPRAGRQARRPRPGDRDRPEARRRRSPRSTVATTTEIHDYLRLLWARDRPAALPDARPGAGRCGRRARSRATSIDGVRRPARLRARAGRRSPRAARADREARRRVPRRAQRAVWREQGFVRVLVDGVEQRLEQPIDAGSRARRRRGAAGDRPHDVRRPRAARRRARAGRRRLGARARSCCRATATATSASFTTDRCVRALRTSRCPSEPHPRWFSFNHHSRRVRDLRRARPGRRCAIRELLVNHPDRPMFGGAIRTRAAAFTFLTQAATAGTPRSRGGRRSATASTSTRRGASCRRGASSCCCGAAATSASRSCSSSEAGKSRTRWRMSVQWKGLARRSRSGSTAGRRRDAGDERFARGDARASLPRLRGRAAAAAAQRHVRVGGVSLPEFLRLTVDDALRQARRLRLRKTERSIAARRAAGRCATGCRSCTSVGLGYLTLDRSAATLSGGEAQRIRLATQLGNRLVGVLYVLDEPTDRPAPARHRAAARDAARAARPRQHGASPSSTTST